MVTAGLTCREVFVSVRDALARAGAPEPEIEARLICQHVLGTSAERWLGLMPEPAPAGLSDGVRPLVARRKAREPLPYILGWREFYRRRFRSDARALVPRPETELLVERALEFAAAREAAGYGAAGAGLRIADVGTGSGVIAVTLALELPQAEVTATDISESALALASENAGALSAGRVRFLLGDLASPLAGVFQIIVSNPPYLRSGEAWEPELAWEPLLALEAGLDGLSVARRLVAGLPALLDPSGSVALIEADPMTASRIADLARSALPWAAVQVLADLAGLERCVEVRVGRDELN